MVGLLRRAAQVEWRRTWLGPPRVRSTAPASRNSIRTVPKSKAVSSGKPANRGADVVGGFKLGAERRSCFPVGQPSTGADHAAGGDRLPLAGHVRRPYETAAAVPWNDRRRCRGAHGGGWHCGASRTHTAACQPGQPMAAGTGWTGHTGDRLLGARDRPDQSSINTGMVVRKFIRRKIDLLIDWPRRIASPPCRLTPHVVKYRPRKAQPSGRS